MWAFPPEAGGLMRAGQPETLDGTWDGMDVALKIPSM
jgi:hypothetical protein